MATTIKNPDSSNITIPMALMVKSAIEQHSDKRYGPSLAAIKKFLIEHYHVDLKKKAPFLRRHLETAVAKGNLIRTKGIGMNGHFKLAKVKESKSKLTNSKVMASSSVASKPVVQAQKAMAVAKEKQMNKKK
ncbi:hypothetical protein BLA29_003163 [Euroglyphus maynei]|uniref:H15 domain-containing protein n=1 Tax=Euroglyphus maynei TaxID=6958 RepID=A0A1Y3B5K3_EURMA|nr:hypothetical protein BLA29_003163 [Euroglyphus maynei]